MKKIETTKGQALLIAVIFFMFASLTAIFGFANPVLKQVSLANRLQDSISSLYLTEALSEDIIYRLKNGLDVDSTEGLVLGAYSATGIISSVGGSQEIVVSSNVDQAVRKQKTKLQIGIGVAFNFGVQAGDGGVLFTNTGGTIDGNIFSNGPVVGVGNDINGDVISAGSNGLIDNIESTGAMYAHQITDSEVGTDAYYQNISSTLVTGTEYPGSSDIEKSELPITEEMIDVWKADAVAGGVTNCSGTKVIQTDTAIGPQKYTCNLTIKKNSTDVTLGGTIWVEGNITFENAPTISITSDYDNKSLVVIADKPSDKTGSGNIEVQNNTTFAGSGDPSSFILLLSGNTSGESGGGVEAINVKNNILGDVLIYAGHGTIRMENNADLKEVTGYKIRIENNAEVIYDTGLASLLFTSGPGGGYEIKSWDEVE